MPGDVLPVAGPVVDVPVGDRDPGELGEDPEFAERLEGALAEEQRGVLLGERACTYFFRPAFPARSVVSSNPATCAAVISALISLTTSLRAPAAFRRQEWMNPSEI